MTEQRCPRLLTRADLRSYLGMISWAECKLRMERGQIPNPLWGLGPSNKDARWDRRAVDRALDDASAIPPSLEAQERLLDRALGIT